ncbi:hypothetical protein A2U01_0051610, partial [Trifolium medium]|nr:hypothetical protein [Trifolium medium]
AKRDKGDRRFGFARFDRVANLGQFEHELDNNIIERDKISVNLSHCQRLKGNNCSDDKSVGRKEIHDNNRSQPTSRISRHLSHHQQSRAAVEDTYAQAVRTGGVTRQEGGHTRFVLSYDAEKNDTPRLKNVFYCGICASRNDI